MTENTLGAFVVKRKQVLLPGLKNRESNSNNTFWCCSTDRNTVRKEILIEAKEETVNGYNLYGTEIPIIFSYPSTFEKTDPKMETCLGVRTKQVKIAKFMKINQLNGPFHYNGKFITDEDVIAWLENEQNIESMKRVREWAIQYGEECKELLEAIKKREREERIRDRVNRYSGYLDKEENAEKIKKMVARRDELVSRYQ